MVSSGFKNEIITSSDLKSDQELVFPLHLYNHIHILCTHREEKPLRRGQRSLKSGSILRKSLLHEKGLVLKFISICSLCSKKPFPYYLKMVMANVLLMTSKVTFSLAENGSICHICWASIPRYKRSQSHRSQNPTRTPTFPLASLWVVMN